MVAKIYDPLYYDGDNEFGRKQDVVRAALGDYSREAAAYTQLQKSPAAKDITPAFHGTWATSIATPVGPYGQQHTHTRTVHLILIEHLHGECMQYVDPYEMRRRTRTRILKKVLDAESIIFSAGVRHRDCHPRNVILLGSAYDAPDLQIKIIDFNIAGVMEAEYEWLRELKQRWPGRRCSPIVFHYGSMSDFFAYGWCSSEDMGAEKWLWRHYKDDPRYFPVTWDLENPFKRPDYKED